MSDAPPSALILRALDPAHSVVVEACAGSGKTWLLASRILRLLLAGVAPGEILAITFTRKAAREIEERVVAWLHFMATGSAAQVSAFLAERGVVAASTDQLHAARGLYERVLAAQPGLAVNTFHGWFLQLVDAAPLSANLAGTMLVDSGSRLFDELWQSFAATLQKAQESAVTQGFVRLLAELGIDSTRRLIRRALDRRSEWLAFGENVPDTAAKVVAALREQLGVSGPGQALAGFFAGDWSPEFQAYLAFLEVSELKGDQEAAAGLRAALAETDRARCFAGLQSALLTRENTLRSKKPGKTLDQRYTAQGAERFLELHEQLGEQLIACLAGQTEERIYAFNQDVCAVFQAFLAHVDEFKQARRQIDFVDAEWNVLKLLRAEDTAAFLQARLDARYRHVLLDEFQDTSPLQWQILLAWLAAYSDAARPSVFLVGDPKQSIYRFRRAEPRLFLVAADFLERDFAAIRCELDATRRNANSIVEVVNALFLERPEFVPFRPQNTLAGALPGRVELLPLCGKADADEGAPARTGLRDPLHEAAVAPEDSRRWQEAADLAEKIREMVGESGAAAGKCWQIEDKAADGRPVQRQLRYGDIMLLVRTRTNLACYERALSAVGIPFAAGSRGGLLAALEVRDIVALLEFLVTPMADLKLAQALRSPLFACNDDELMRLASRPEASWWERLQALLASGLASPCLARAGRLLGEWLEAADRLPAHDLLDRIFHQGEVLARYRLAVPEALNASADANLRALLLLALDLDGGRYPSLPRFIDELRDLREADAGEAPDEGVIETQSTDAGRVRILTIHGAKGLEAPVVWLLDANATPRGHEAWDLLVDWPPQAPAPQHVSFYGRKEERGTARQPLFDAELAAARREELNLLYVAMTRARQVFIASGIETTQERGETPYRLLAAALARLGSVLVHGDKLPVLATTPLAKSLPLVQAGGMPLPPVGERRRLPDAAERFGLLLHAVLERRTGRLADDGWWMTMGFDDGEYQRALPVAERLLGAEHLQPFFDPAQYRRAWNEVELITSAGVLHRVDRLVEIDAVFWVLDYKSSRSDSARLDEYRAQVANYCQAVAEVFPGNTVRGALVFADASLLEVV
ncbi:UvrD-helicase domain-containing protein [Propionivibrio sp.]|uniref:UvrD-helicase domain-containing protein n=1 Tax=Propionivibrio sp. TaxID=2212460 RepID=UPI00261CD274|nr:UvrD-helicase domain-containing protein [Propionivibrio sp.]